MGYNTSMDTKDLLTTGQVAKLYGVQRRTVTMWIRRKLLIPTVTWGRFGISRTDLAAFDAQRANRSRTRGQGHRHPRTAVRSAPAVNSRTGKKIQKK